MSSQSFIARITIPAPRNTDIRYNEIGFSGDQAFFIRNERGTRVLDEHIRLQTVVDEIPIALSYSVLPTHSASSIKEAPVGDEDAAASIAEVVRELKRAMSELQQQHVKLQENVRIVWHELTDHRRCTKPMTDNYQQALHAEQMRKADQAFEVYVDSKHELRPVAGRPRSVTVSKVWDVRQLEKKMIEEAKRANSPRSVPVAGTSVRNSVESVESPVGAQEAVPSAWSPPPNHFTNESRGDASCDK